MLFPLFSMAYLHTLRAVWNTQRNSNRINSDGLFGSSFMLLSLIVFGWRWRIPPVGRYPLHRIASQAPPIRHITIWQRSLFLPMTIGEPAPVVKIRLRPQIDIRSVLWRSLDRLPRTAFDYPINVVSPSVPAVAIIVLSPCLCCTVFQLVPD